ncbi:MutS family DNA mismatch repair protein [Thalassoroseus pseudoceratinae]|uniref:MutS family DNA mismatch repair protein n=1 Tax=Thalassoroseus pseudoceratinae TaxID=2713176 RepID=UPI0014207E43|nr:MutS family DNA mismatch repair protein [Thalassoroseus pseudoceratinae]
MPDTPRKSPRSEYLDRLQSRSAVVSALKTVDGRIATARGLVFLAGIILTVLVFQETCSAGWLLLPFLAFVALVIWHGRVLKRLSAAQLAVTYYERGLKRLDDEWFQTGATGERYGDPNHVYSGDLDLFGDGSLFQLLCRARTRLGEDVLANWLLSPAGQDEIQQRQQSVRELRPELDLREELALLSAVVHDELDQNRLREWSVEPPAPVEPWRRVLAFVLAASTLTGLVLWLFLGYRLSVFVAPLLLEIVFVASSAGTIRRVFDSVDIGNIGLQILSEVLVIIEARQFESELLVRSRQALETDGLPPSAQIAKLHQLTGWLNNSLQNQFFFPFAFVLCLPLHLVHAIEKWREDVGSHIPQWLDVVGRFEALSSLAGHSYERPDDPFPEIVAEGPVLDGVELGHPLLPDADCVRNDLALDSNRQLVLISGSNMSGKSTLLRTVGTNAVLALAGGPVRAKSLRLTSLQLGTAMRISDSLQDGRSLFYSVLRRLKAVVDLAEDERPLLFLLDEILQGTNSHDRRVGSEGVIKKLIEKGAVGLVTTHDLALTDIVQELDGKAENAHFEDHIEDGEMTFDYKIRPGVVQKSNALELMRMIGLDV